MLQPYLDVEVPVYREGDWVDAGEAKSLLQKMQKLAEKAEAFLSAPARGTAGASGS